MADIGPRSLVCSAIAVAAADAADVAAVVDLVDVDGDDGGDDDDCCCWSADRLNARVEIVFGLVAAEWKSFAT